MGLAVELSPPEGGEFLLDGETYNPRIPYSAGKVVRIKVRPAGGYQFAGWSGDVPAGHEADVPLEMTIPEDDRQITATFVSGVEHAQELVFDSGFENGNGILRYQHQEIRALVIEPQQLRGSTNIWWHFKVHGITPGEFLQLRIVHNPTTEPEFAGDCHPVYSYDGIAWHRFTCAKSPFIQRFDAPTVEISRNIPYPYSKTLRLVTEIEGPEVQAMDLAESEEGRAIKVFRITDPDTHDRGKRIVWMMARQHAFESHSSWYAEYFIRWCLGDDPLAAELRRETIIYVTPIMDVDNVYNGGAGKEQLAADGRRADFNRSWGPHSPWAAVRAAKRLLENLKLEHEIVAFFDMHNPWYPNTPSWHFPWSHRELSYRFADMWSAELEATDSGVQWKHRMVTRDPGSSERSREPTLDMLNSGSYAAQHLCTRPESHLCITIETAHWHDGYGNLITQESLQAYATALGRALTRHLVSQG